VTTTLSLGQRAHLAALGIDPADLGRVFNRVSAPPAAPPGDVPVPRNADELAEMLADPARGGQILASTESLTAWVQAYANQQQAPGTDLNRLVAEETQRVLAEFLKDNEAGGEGGIKRLNLDPQAQPAAGLTSHRQATAYNPKAIGAALDKEFPSSLDYFKATWHRNPDLEVRAKVEQVTREIRNAFGSTVPSDGGFLVPEALRSQMLALGLDQSVVRQRATVVPMETARVQFPLIDSTTNVGSVFGGMIGYWGEEGAALTDSSAKFGRVTLDAKKLTGLSLVPNELLADSMSSFAALVEGLWPRALVFFEDTAFMTGTGAGEPLGFVGAANPASIGVDKETNQTAATIALENVLSMYSRMLPGSLATAIWITTPEALRELFTMALSVGTGGAPVMLVNAAGPAPMNILGRPLVVCEKASRLGTRGDLIFADLSYYLIGDRQAMSVDSSTDYRFANDQTAYRIIQRVDGRPWLQSPITPQNGGPTLSPFVEIATRA
jgi:HK97 family phage major capsid protein